MLATLAGLSACQVENPGFLEGQGSQGTDVKGERSTDSQASSPATDTGGDASQDVDGSQGAGTTVEDGSTTQGGTVPQNDSSSSASSGSTSASSQETSSDTQVQWSYCAAPASLCLNMNDPVNPDLKTDPMVFGTGNNASYAITTKPSWPEVSWISVKGVEPVRSDKSTEIRTATGASDGQLGIDVWLRSTGELVSDGEVFLELQDLMSIGRANDGKIRCSRFLDSDWDRGLAWRTTSMVMKNVDQWQHVACYSKGTTFGIWYLGSTNEQMDGFGQNSFALMNERTSAKLILGTSDWINGKINPDMPTSKVDIAGLRVWSDVATMLKVLRQESEMQ